MTEKVLWSGRFKEVAAEDTLAFTSSLAVDKRLARYDVLGSLAHAKMLAKQGIIKSSDGDSIAKGLKDILAMIDDGTFLPSGSIEDVHSYVEFLLISKVKDAGARLHTARSRNDQVATDVRMFMRDATLDTIEAILFAERSLVERAKNELDTIMPGFTHVQHAQPVTLAHHLMAHAFRLERDAGRLIDSFKRLDLCPLGSAALAGTTYAIDRTYTAQLLAFNAPTSNSMDGVSDRDFAAEYIFSAGMGPFTTPILTEVPGAIKFGDITEGQTMQEKLDPVTGKSSKVVVEFRESDVRPRISIKDEKGRTAKVGEGGAARYFMPVGAILMVTEGDQVFPGDVLARIPRETTKTKDITGGLPRVAELFEVRKPKENAVITEIDGVVSFGKDTKGKRKVVITPQVGDPREYLIPKGKHISVHEGDYVRAGEALMDGSPNPHDILTVLGEKEVAKYLVDEVQQVYRLQGVKINDKHIEVIVRQMLKRVRITDPGDSEFLLGEHVEKPIFEDVNQQLVTAGQRPAAAEPLLLGITKASLSTQSFISAASFQETTKVLTDAATAGKVDHLLGLKENVIMGRLIPAGSGLRQYRDIRK